jgi:hypothetical protein
MPGILAVLGANVAPAVAGPAVASKVAKVATPAAAPAAKEVIPKIPKGAKAIPGRRGKIPIADAAPSKKAGFGDVLSDFMTQFKFDFPADASTLDKLKAIQARFEADPPDDDSFDLSLNEAPGIPEISSRPRPTLHGSGPAISTPTPISVEL